MGGAMSNVTHTYVSSPDGATVPLWWCKVLSGETWISIRSSDKLWDGEKWQQLGDDTVYVIPDTYPVCRVGVGEIGQVWTCRNLEDLANGICYNNDVNNLMLYGTLHTQPQTVSIWESCQGDYHPARLDEWKTLISLAGGATYGAINLKAADGWSSVQGVDYFGFSALPGGQKATSAFAELGTAAVFSVLDASSDTTSRFVKVTNGTTGNLLYASAVSSKATAYSVRFVANTGKATINGIEYPVCQIGGLWWQAENDKSTSFSTPRNDSALNELYGPVRNFTQLQNYDSQLKAAGSTWRVPRGDEFYQNIIAELTAANGGFLKAPEVWGASYPGNNWANFNALPGGYGLSSANVGTRFVCGTATETDSTNFRIEFLVSSNATIAQGAYPKTTYVSTRLVKRFYRVPMPWGEVRTFVHIGGLYIDTRNLDWAGEDGSLGVYYADDSTLGAVYGRLYSKAEHDRILAYLAERKIPVSTLDATQFSTLTTYNSGNASTQAVNLCDAELFSGVTNLYELSLVPNGVYTGNAFAELGFTCYLMSRAGILSFDASGLCETLDVTGNQKAAIRLCYAAPESVIA